MHSRRKIRRNAYVFIHGLTTRVDVYSVHVRPRVHWRAVSFGIKFATFKFSFTRTRVHVDHENWRATTAERRPFAGRTYSNGFVACCAVFFGVRVSHDQTRLTASVSKSRQSSAKWYRQSSNRLASSLFCGLSLKNWCDRAGKNRRHSTIICIRIIVM